MAQNNSPNSDLQPLIGTAPVALLVAPAGTAWNRAKVETFKKQFYRFLPHVEVNSKELGKFKLGDAVYQAQRRFLDGVFDALARDVHDIYVLKSRQLGISTISRALTLFWIGMHDGLKGYMIFDTDAHKEEARIELVNMLDSLPPSVKFPRKKRDNRGVLELTNGSMITFASAGVKKSKGSGTLGRSSGVNFSHGSEMCSWDNAEGLEAFRHSLAENFPNRLYIWESTARGFNQWHEMWEEAKRDPEHKATVFLGWWAKDNQVIPQTHPDFQKYGSSELSDKEIERIKAVRDTYGVQITLEQLAWFRRKMNPAADTEGELQADFDGSSLQIQDQPWTEEEAFQMTGATFFDTEALTQIAKETIRHKYDAYDYATGIEFTDCRIYKSRNLRVTQLKVWAEPEDGALYVVAADPAFGHDEKNDRSAIQVLRCYADGVEQVAEYAFPLVNTSQFAWVIASLLGWYAGERNEVYFILEINGPGEAVWNEMRSLKHHLQRGYQREEVDERGLKNIFRNVRDYIYNRSDSMSAGFAWQWKTQTQLKVAIMERLRDFTGNGKMVLRSQDTLEEMKSVAREGDSIKAQGSKKDDRVIALAMGIRCWEERCRPRLVAQGRTRAVEEARKSVTLKDQVQLFNGFQLDKFFQKKQAERRRDLNLSRRLQWRGRA
jgi:hypothetical protein